MKGKKTGGRVKGTPNSNNPLKGFLRDHSFTYFQPKPQTEADGVTPRIIVFHDKEGNELGDISLTDNDGKPRVMSDFDVDMMMLEPNERVNAELRLLEYHTPKMKAVEIDMDARITPKTIEDRLAQLCAEPGGIIDDENIDNPDD